MYMYTFVIVCIIICYNRNCKRPKHKKTTTGKKNNEKLQIIVKLSKAIRFAGIRQQKKRKESLLFLSEE